MKEVRKVNCYGQEVESMETPESKDLGSQTPQALTFNDGMGEVKDEQTPGWTTAASDMKFEYLLYGHHREQIACQACGKTFSDEGRLRKHKKLHTADRPFVCEMCTKGFTTQAHLKEHLKIHTGYKPYSSERHENNMHSERKQVTPSAIQSETEQLQAAAMAAEAEQQLETIACS
ncbi:Zinc finger and BTB domain-containing protein 14 [Microtus ochrogaster]|uniref:Zinc finger and BTB domain-containing protein 14 n=1 Tax=Microtus ochrogaster TaxID=79684 RepID=A0A8J6L224_MICOH|nr:Zinc finger and BTB domain-containing protein 14 [Microtus ochrogaster]